MLSKKQYVKPTGMVWEQRNAGENVQISYK